MKTKIISTAFSLLTFSMLFVLSILFSCNGSNNKSFISGTFVNHAEGSYSIADDTLTIEHSGGDNYLIHRSTGFNLIRDGKKGKREHETEEWNAIYNKESGTLTETRKRKILTFYPDANKLMIGQREYQKIN